MKVFNKPEPHESSETYANKKALQNQIFELRWEKDYTFYIINKTTFNKNWVDSFALIWDTYFSEEIQISLEKMPDYEIVVTNQPLKFLERVKTQSTRQ